MASPFLVHGIINLMSTQIDSSTRKLLQSKKLSDADIAEFLETFSGQHSQSEPHSIAAKLRTNQSLSEPERLRLHEVLKNTVKLVRTHGERPKALADYIHQIKAHQ